MQVKPEHIEDYKRLITELRSESKDYNTEVLAANEAIFSLVDELDSQLSDLNSILLKIRKLAQAIAIDLQQRAAAEELDKDPKVLDLIASWEEIESLKDFDRPEGCEIEEVIVKRGKYALLLVPFISPPSEAERVLQARISELQAELTEMSTRRLLS
jgi:hypothetical protein